MDVRIRDSMELSLPAATLDWTLDFASERLQKTLAYWLTCRGERKRPEREDMKPAEMERFLRHIALIDVRHLVMAGRFYRVRLAGTYVEHVFGAMSGRRFEEILPRAISVRWLKCLDAVFERDRPLRLAGRIQFEDRSWLSSEVLLVPLGDEARPISMILAAFVWQTNDQPIVTVRDAPA